MWLQALSPRRTASCFFPLPGPMSIDKNARPPNDWSPVSNQQKKRSYHCGATASYRSWKYWVHAKSVRVFPPGPCARFPRSRGVQFTLVCDVRLHPSACLRVFVIFFLRPLGVDPCRALFSAISLGSHALPGSIKENRAEKRVCGTLGTYYAHLLHQH